MLVFLVLAPFAEKIFTLVATQGLMLTLLVGWRLYKRRSMRDPIVLGVGAFMAVNAALARSWVWFGT